MASFRQEGFVYACSPIGADDTFNIGLTRVSNPREYVKNRYKGAFCLRLLARVADVRAAEIKAHATLAPYLVSGREVFRVPDIAIVEEVFREIEKDSGSDDFNQNLQLIATAAGMDMTFVLPKEGSTTDTVRWLPKDSVASIAGSIEVYSALSRKKALLLTETRSISAAMDVKQDIINALVAASATAIKGDDCVITLSVINQKPPLTRRAIADILKRHPKHSSEADEIAEFIFENNASRRRTDLNFREMPF